MGCGVAPGGSLRLAHLAAKLTPSISGGPHMPVSPHPPSSSSCSGTACVCLYSSIVPVCFLPGVSCMVLENSKTTLLCKQTHMIS